MAFAIPITIEEVIKNIDERKYLLPDIQREVVWGTEEMELFFDSLMRDYPIGSLLFWELSKEHIKEHPKDYKFYEFIRAYSEYDSKHNPKANINGKEDVTSILDGQQRLTALYIGLKGTYAYKLHRKKDNSPSAYPLRKLYLNLRNDLSMQEDSNRAYDFKFLTYEEAKEKNEKSYWFEVGEILNFEEYQVGNYLREHNLINIKNPNDNASIFANRTLFKLHTIIHKNNVINYYLEKSYELDKVLDIFIRVNNGGTRLNYTDLLLSMATASWENREAKQEIIKFVDEINCIGDGFKFDQDFILRACLVLTDVNNVNFKVDNFKKKTMLLIEKNWDNITQSINSAVLLVSSFGYNERTLTSNNSIIPVAYYLLKRGLPSNFELSLKYNEDRKLISKWLIRSLLKKVFSAHPENLYRSIREIIKENSEENFPLDKIIEKFRGAEKSISFGEDDIENLFSYEYGKSYTFSALAVLYPNLDYRNKFHVDHIFPKTFFTKKKLIKKGIDSSKISYYLENYNSMANLQLLEGIKNQEKSGIDFKEWLHKTYKSDEDRKEYMKKNYIPNNIELDISNFEKFMEERKKLMFKKYEKFI
ncbi:GmrSD restriction endonuclease domain-containing protein [Clostridium cagae]|uniref:DUF262 domain-containing protein n=1 Tax=Clostridium cagae TaxID=2080751 RepID=UPI003F7638B6